MHQQALTTVALFVLLDRTRRTRRQHRHWVHPIHQARQTHGEYHRFVQELRLDSYLFQRYFRLNIEQFDDLLSRVGPRITKEDTWLRRSIGPAERLAICLR